MRDRILQVCALCGLTGCLTVLGVRLSEPPVITVPEITPITVSYIYDNYDDSDEEVEEHLVTVVEEPTYVDYAVPSYSGFKSFMPYKAITSVSSPQYILQAEEAYTGDHGIRQVDGRYCIAVGSHFTSTIGTYLDLILENGTVIPCILADQKANIHTDAQNIFTLNGCATEFVVDMDALTQPAKRMGDISYCDESWKSPVTTIRVYTE